tara:strand:+ start:2337 stop:3062 length:726 start_codon:yes stop_codon:yes gene_type:complete
VFYNMIESIAFHGSGGLLWYYMGIAEYIQNNYIIDSIKFCSVSGGCLPGVFLSSGLDIQQIWKECFLPWMQQIDSISCENTILPTFTPDSTSILLKYLNTSIINKDAVLQNINDKLSIRLTKISLFDAGSVYVDKWDSIEDVLDCVSASCWIPGLFGKLTKTYKGSEYMDGGFPNSIQENNPNWLHIKISSFQNISKDMKTFLYLSSLSSISNPKVAQELYDLGYKDSSENPQFFNSLIKK